VRSDRFSPTAAPNRLIASATLAHNGKIDRAIQGDPTAQQWDPSLPRFDPVARANALAKAAQSKQR